MTAVRSLDERLRDRLEALERELEAGRQTVAELDAQRLGVRATMLRLSGAITVLREELGRPATTDAEDHAG